MRDTFALVVSMSHIIGDGHTFYRISDQLSTDSSIISLDASREGSNITRKVEEALGKAETGFLTSAKFGLSMVSGAICQILFGPLFGWKIREEFYKFNVEFI